MWSRRTAERHVARVLDLAEEALPLLGTVDDDTRPGDELNRRVKFLMETALLLQAVHRSTALPPALRRRALDLGRAVAPFARHARLSAVILLKPSVAAEYAVAHGCLTSLGLADPGFHDAVTGSLAEPVARCFQRLPWKELELAWAEDALGITGGASEPASALPLTFLARGLDVLGSSRAELYHLTHEVIYASDFGHRRFVGPRPLPELLRDVDGAIARTLDDDDFDLCAELLLVAPFLGGGWSTTAGFALTALLDVVDRFGVLPSMTFHPDGQADTSAAERRLFFLRESYHTQYVLAFLMLATLLPGRAPHGPAAEPVDRPELVERLGGTPALWESTSAVPGEDARVDVALLRAYARRDFALVATLLTEHGHRRTRVVEQVAAALVRLGGFARRAG